MRGRRGVAAAAARRRRAQRAAPELLRELEDNDWPELDHPIRARIIGDCFDAYINQCSTYKPLLSKIKSEYEERNALLSKQLEEVKPKLNKL